MKKEKLFEFEIKLIREQLDNLEKKINQSKFEDLADLCPGCKEPIGDCACIDLPELITPDGIGFVETSAGNPIHSVSVGGIVNGDKVLLWRNSKQDWVIEYVDEDVINYNYPLQKTIFGELKDGDVFCDNEESTSIESYSIKKGTLGTYWEDGYPERWAVKYDEIVYKVMPK